MTGMRAVEDRPTPKAVYGIRIWLQALAIAWGALTFGYDSAFLGTTISQTSFKKAFGVAAMTKAQQNATNSNITSTFQAAAFFGSLFSWLFNERFGRKPALQVASAIFMVGSILMTVTNSNLGMIYAGRALTGIGCGAITAVVPPYIAELSPVAIRGILTGLFEIFYQVGAVVGFWVNYGISDSKHINPASSVTWRLPMAIQLIPGGILMAASFVILESPAYLYRKGNEEKALQNLSYLRNLPADHTYIQEEIAMIEERLQEELAVAGEGRGMWSYIKGCFKELMVKGMRNRLVIVFCSFALQNFSGANAINYYSPTLFASIGITGIKTSLYTGVYGLIKAISSIIFYIFFIDSIGRKKSWIASSSLCALCLIYVGVYVKVGHPAGQTHPSASTTAGGKAATGIIMIYSFLWAFGMNGLPWIISAEIFPIRVRSFTGAYSASCQWLWQYVITKSTPYIFASMGWGTWIFFAGCLILSVLFAIFFLPETKGLTIDQIDVAFGLVTAYTHGHSDRAASWSHSLPHGNGNGNGNGDGRGSASDSAVGTADEKEKDVHRETV